MAGGEVHVWALAKAVELAGTSLVALAIAPRDGQMKSLSDELGWRPTEGEVRDALSMCKRVGTYSQAMAMDAGFTLSDGRWVQMSFFR